ncbi:MAG: hypothetical protein PARBB_01264 [Parabacteroides distasonis]|uniref:hypothetical protein n=1 Tax=Parabacteroides sp. TaxID=1869337 RepID=UPI00257F1630|nr:hypothetical protein [Parabacteroides sp.]
MEHDNLFIQILEILSIKYTKDFTLRFYEKHPHKNSLFGLSEMLRYYKIENVAAEIQKTQECLSSLDVPFVAYVDHEFDWYDMFLPRQSSIHGEVKHHIIYPGILGTMVRNRPSFRIHR